MNGKRKYRFGAEAYNYVIEPLLRRVKARTVRICKKHRYSRILDLCCGIGTQCALLSKEGFEVFGLDGSLEMLSVARKNSPPAVKYFHARASDLCFQKETFDCVIVSFALHENGRKGRDCILSEARRILRPDGNVILADYIVPNGYISWVANLASRCIEWCGEEDDYQNFKQFMCEGGLRGSISRSNLCEVESYRFHFGATGLIVAK